MTARVDRTTTKAGARQSKRPIPRQTRAAESGGRAQDNRKAKRIIFTSDKFVPTERHNESEKCKPRPMSGVGGRGTQDRGRTLVVRERPRFYGSNGAI